MKNTHKSKAKQRVGQARSTADTCVPYQVDALTPFDFRGKHLTPVGGLLPVAAMLERLGFADLAAQEIHSRRTPRGLSLGQLLLATVLGMYLGLFRFHQFRFIAADPMLNGVLHTTRLPAQSTFWRFLAGLHLSVGRRMVRLQEKLRARVWRGADVRVRRVTLDTDTTVHTLYGRQMGGRVSYSPKKKGARSHQPILTFLAETREYVAGKLRNGDRPSAVEIQAHLRHVLASLPPGVREIRARADSGFYCWRAVETYLSGGCEFIIVARKTARLVEQLRNERWKASRHKGAEEADFVYQPEGWGQPCRFVALRFPKAPSRREEAPEQYQLFETSAYTYRVFVTNLKGPVYRVVDFYNHRCAAENLIKEANHEAGIEVHPFYRFDMNENHFQCAMLAYNLNCWLALFARAGSGSLRTMRHTTLGVARQRFLFIAARLWRHAGQTGVSYSDTYAEKGALRSLMARLRQLPPLTAT